MGESEQKWWIWHVDRTNEARPFAHWKAATAEEAAKAAAEGRPVVFGSSGQVHGSRPPIPPEKKEGV